MGSRAFIGFETILVAYDGSPQSQHALQIALTLAKMASSKVLVFSVVRIPLPAQRAELNAVLDDGREGYERSFVAIREQAKESDIELETEIAVGKPADQIIHRAETFQASLIVMGRREKSAVQHWIRGSSAERVLRYSSCPVMLVH
jgi:nucleotide-binding universal stress UspA family protein